MKPDYDPLEWHRRSYGVPAFRLRVVFAGGKRGVISGASGPHIKVWLDGEKSDHPYHPRDLEYTEETGRLARLTRSQRNYRAFLHSETSESFIEFLRNPYWNDLRART